MIFSYLVPWVHHLRQCVAHDDQWLVYQMNNPILYWNIPLHYPGLHHPPLVLLIPNHCLRYSQGYGGAIYSLLGHFGHHLQGQGASGGVVLQGWLGVCPSLLWLGEQ